MLKGGRKEGSAVWVNDELIQVTDAANETTIQVSRNYQEPKSNYKK